MNLDRAEAVLKKLPIRDFLTQRTVPFRMYESQRRVLGAMKEQQRAGRPIRVIVLKSRRQGISTLVDNILALHCQSRPSTTALIVTHNYRSSQALFKAPKMLLTESIGGAQSLKSVLGMPAMTQHQISFPHKTGSNSTLTIATAGNVEGGRGDAFTDLHLSELAFYQSEATFAALLPTVPRANDTMVVIETTANGRVGIGQPFFDFWNATLRGDTDFSAQFLSWLEDPNNVDSNTVIKDAPADDEERELLSGINVNGRIIKATLEQLAWRRSTINSPICRGYVDIFDQEYPSTPDRAFIATGEPAFTKEEMGKARLTVQKPVLRGEFQMDGDHIGWINDQRGPWLIWDRPEKNHRYYFGVDAARGTDTGDFAAIVGFDGDTGNQVVRYQMRIDPEMLAYVCNMAGRYYNNAMLCIELTGNLGLWAQSRLRDKYRYPNLYRWRGTRDDKTRPGTGGKAGSYGWETGWRSRERAMIAYREAIKHDMIQIRDGEIVRQMDLCTRKDYYERWEIKMGHDDVLMATLLGNISRSEWHIGRIGDSNRVTTDHDEKPLRHLDVQPSVETIDTLTAESFKQLFKARQDWEKRRSRTLEGI